MVMPSAREARESARQPRSMRASIRLNVLPPDTGESCQNADAFAARKVMEQAIVATPASRAPAALPLLVRARTNRHARQGSAAPPVRRLTSTSFAEAPATMPPADSHA